MPGEFFGGIEVQQGGLIRGLRLGGPGAPPPEGREVFKSFEKFNEKITILKQKLPNCKKLFENFEIFKKI